VKFDSSFRLFTRKHIYGDWVIPIGKKTKNIEEQTLDGGIVQVFKNKESERERVIQMRQSHAERMGINRGRGGGGPSACTLIH
jgi:hypothetical protein